MATADGTSSPTDRKSFRRLLCGRNDFGPLITGSPPSPPRTNGSKKKGFAALAFRGLGCTSSSSSQVYAPAAAAVRSSADWQGKRSRRRRVKQKRNKERRNHTTAADVWCAPGIAFAAADDSVDCVVSHHQIMVGRGGRHDSERIERERSYAARRAGNQQQIYTIMDSLSSLGAPLLGSDGLPSGYFNHFQGYHQSPGGLEEIMMFHNRILWGGMNMLDRYRDWRLDVDNMSYEELLELGEKIGDVCTGLREEEIFRSLRKMKHSTFDASQRPRFSTELERKCSICQEEYEVDDELGNLKCGHSYHIHCIKQWLLQKNACPVCKTAVIKT